MNPGQKILISDNSEIENIDSVVWGQKILIFSDPWRENL